MAGSDSVQVYSEDWTSLDSAIENYFPPGSASTVATDFQAYLQACADAAIFLVTQTTTQYSAAPSPGVASSTGQVWRAALLHFQTPTLQTVDVQILGPNPACFLMDNTVDPAYGPIAALITWFTANGTAPDGESVSVYLGGELAGAPLGSTDVVNAASYVSDGGVNANFHPSDGADAKEPT